jgi:hypothetical protein
MATPTRDQLDLLGELDAHGGTLHVARCRYFDFERLEQLGLVTISALAGRDFHCAITDKGRAAIANPRAQVSTGGENAS